MKTQKGWLATRRQAIQQLKASVRPKPVDYSTVPALPSVPTRKKSKEARKSFKANARELQRDCMLNMSRPKHHSPVPYLVGEREKTLFAAHLKRQASGWLHG